jgi:hypothetical protein
MRVSLFLIVCLIAVSCGNNNTPVATSNFDTKHYFLSEVERLTLLQTSINKKVRYNDTEELITSSPPIDWNKELKPFIDIDLGRPTLSSSFLVDSTQNGELLIINYQAIDNKLDLQHVTIEKVSNQIKKISCLLIKTNSLFKSSTQLVYQPLVGYQISGNQDVTQVSNNSYTIEATWIINANQ